MDMDKKALMGAGTTEPVEIKSLSEFSSWSTSVNLTHFAGDAEASPPVLAAPQSNAFFGTHIREAIHVLKGK